MAQRLSEISIKSYLNSSFETFFVLTEASVRPQKNGKECMSLILKDRDVEIEAKIFDINDSHKDTLKVGKVYYAVVDVKEYAKGKNGISCIINSMPQEMTDMRPEMFADWIEGYEDYNTRLGVLFNYISDSPYGKIAYDIIQSRWEKFCIWGAAKSNHHTSFGGLLMHSVCVAENCKEIGEFYNKVYGMDFVNIKLLVSAGLLHDAMKTEELTCDRQSGTMDYDVGSSLSTHVVEIAIEVEKSALKLGIEDKYVVGELKHCLLAHHGQLEYGSPITPSCMEASILNYMDELDAAGWRYSKANKDLKIHERSTIWVGGKPFSVFRTSNNEDVEI